MHGMLSNPIFEENDQTITRVPLPPLFIVDLFCIYAARSPNVTVFQPPRLQI